MKVDPIIQADSRDRAPIGLDIDIAARVAKGFEGSPRVLQAQTTAEKLVLAGRKGMLRLSNCVAKFPSINLPSSEVAVPLKILPIVESLLPK